MIINFNTQVFQIKKKINKLPKRKFIDLFLDGYNYDDWFDNPNDEESDDKTINGDKEKVKIEFGQLLCIPPEGDKEGAKEGKGLKVLTPNKLLTKLLLAQIIQTD